MGQNALASILALILYLTGQLGGGGQPGFQPGLSPALPAQEVPSYVPSQPLPGATAPGRKIILGYYVNDGKPSSHSSLERARGVLNAVAPWMWRLESNGQLSTTFDRAAVAASLRVVGSQNAAGYGLFHNFNGRTFDGALAHRLLSDPTSRGRAIGTMLQALRTWGLTGVHIDLENVWPSDRQALSNFMAELAAELRPRGFQVTMAVPAKTADVRSNSWSGAFDYAALGRSVDFLALMTYDEHSRGGGPGPVASIGWVESVLQFATGQVPPSKILLGIPAYGYDWPPGGGNARAVTYALAMEIASRNGAQIRWHPQHKVPYFQYGGGRQVWFEDRYSLAYKLDLVNKYRLRGIALWRLGQEDPRFWQVIAERL